MTPLNGPLPTVPTQLTESIFGIYRWEEGGEMHFERRLYLKHEIGEQVTAEMVRDAVDAEVYDFKPAKYRAIPMEWMVDFEVKGEVVLS